MKLLIDKYSQAELAMVLDAKNATLPYLSTLILIDLITKDVITLICEKDPELHFGKIHLFLKIGNQIDEHLPKKYEERLLSHLKNKKSTSTILLIGSLKIIILLTF